MIVFKLHRPECRTARPDPPFGSWQLTCSPGRALRSLAPRAGPGILFSSRAGVLGHAGPGIQGQAAAVEPPPVRKGLHRILETGNWQLPCSQGRALRSLAPRVGSGIQGQVSAVEPPPVRKGFHRILGTGNWQLICDPNIKTAALHELCSAPPRLPFPDSRTMTGH